MAEARSIASMQTLKTGVFVVQDDRGFHLRFDVTIPSANALMRMMRKAIVKETRRVKSLFFPIGAPVATATIGGFIPLVLSRHSDSWLRSGRPATVIWNSAHRFAPFTRLGHTQKIGVLAAMTGITISVLWAGFSRVFLRWVLSYQGYMFEKKPGVRTKLFFAWTKLQQLLNGGRRGPALYSWQSCIPKLPVPPLRDTVRRYLQSVRPLLDDVEYEDLDKTAKRFLQEEGPSLQRWLVLKSFVYPNYVTDWWEKYVYLMGRDSIMINSNYYVMDRGGPPPTKVAAARAAGITTCFLDFKARLDADDPFSELLYPPWFCMSQYERIFSTCRVPGVDIDRIVHWDAAESQHIAVMRHGIWYRINVRHPNGVRLSAPELEEQFQWIIDTADGINNGTFGSKPSPAEAQIAGLTGIGRTEWAQVREEHLMFGRNRESLHAIESSIFCVFLEDKAWTNPDDIGHDLIHGKGGDRWFDKSICLVVYPDGWAGMNCEHSWADAPIISHVSETTVLSNKGEFLPGFYGPDGHVIGKNKHHASAERKKLERPSRLTWDLGDTTEKSILEAVARNNKAASDLDLRVIEFKTYGKGFVKGQKMSPDAYVQMALQLAYYRCHKKFVLTYESCMTRMFRDGRTETVRPVSDDSVAFVRAMQDPSVSDARRHTLLRQATDTHSTNARMCSTGKGVDRHMFALYVVSKAMDKPSAFLQHVLSQPWVLSTSQQPQCQTTLWDPKKNPERISYGGGFGPVSIKGYGASYQILEDRFYFHVSSNVSSPDSDSESFVKELHQALLEMQRMCLGSDKKSK